ncbi:MAG: EamA family transporter RarD [Anaerolineae bacterium]|nr:EamA family transporter RarD [Anaerolineae bacterium]
MNKGSLYAISAYVIWGFFPVFFKTMQNVPALQIMTHRVVWSFVFLISLVVLRGELRAFVALLTPRNLVIYLGAGALIAGNWLLYVWGVNSGYILETSLGYFINPLVSVVLGMVILGERLRTWQWLPVALAGVGVLYLTISYGKLPWIALALACSFGLYGLVKKIAPLGSLYGTTLETGMVWLPALAYLLLQEGNGTGYFAHSGMATTLLLATTGVVTAVPLLLFASGARRVPLTTMGLLQYIAPTLQFLSGVLIYGEPFNTTRAVGFSIIWLALIIFSIESFVVHRKALSLAA